MNETIKWAFQVKARGREREKYFLLFWRCYLWRRRRGEGDWYKRPESSNGPCHCHIWGRKKKKREKKNLILFFVLLAEKSKNKNKKLIKCWEFCSFQFAIFLSHSPASLQFHWVRLFLKKVYKGMLNEWTVDPRNLQTFFPLLFCFQYSQTTEF